MKRNLRKLMSVLVALVLFLQCAPFTALAEIIVANSRSLRLIEPDADIYVTYEFYVGDEKVDEQIINQTDKEVPTVVPETPSVEDGKEFLGWYIGETPYQPNVATTYDKSTTVTVNAKFSDVYYVYFMTVKDDADGNRSVYSTVRATADNGYKAAAPTNYEPKRARGRLVHRRGADPGLRCECPG